MISFVVDTNVAVVANGVCDHADPACVIACINKLADIRRDGAIVLDDSMLILSEYMDLLSLSGEPGAGDLFMKWVWEVQADESRCKLVHITECDSHPCGFLEAPNDSDLAGFDRSDTKFLAAAAASGRPTEVLNAVDSDWAHHHPALARNGIAVRFICPQHVCPSE